MKFILMILIPVLVLPVLSDQPPGALITPTRDLSFISDQIVIHLNHDQLPHSFEQLHVLEKQLPALRAQVEELASLDITASLSQHWAWKLSCVQEWLDETVSTLPAPHTNLSTVSPDVQGRVKRGAASVIGTLTAFFFGVATAVDINTLKNNFQNLKLSQEGLSDALVANSRLLAQHETILGDITLTVNNLTNLMNDLSQQQHNWGKALLLNSYIDSLYDQVNFYHSVFLTTIENIHLLSQGVITPSLLPFSELVRLLRLATGEYKYKPAVPENHLERYYSLIEPVLEQGRLYLLIPFVEKKNYYVTEVVPFPDNFNYTAVVLQLKKSTFLWNEAETLMAFPSERAMASCKEIASTYICDPSLFNLVNFKPTCHHQLIHPNKDNVISYNLCNFTHYSGKDVKIFPMEDYLYVFVPQRQPALLSCPGEKPHASQVIGRVKIPRNCIWTTRNKTYTGIRRSVVTYRKRNLLPAVHQEYKPRPPPERLNLLPLNSRQKVVVPVLPTAVDLKHPGWAFTVLGLGIFGFLVGMSVYLYFCCHSRFGCVKRQKRRQENLPLAPAASAPVNNVPIPVELNIPMIL